MLHYRSDVLNFKRCDWESYSEANRQVATQVASQAADGNIVWIHDCHLILLPAMLFKEAAKRNKRFVIGFFLHTHFPSSDMFKIVPVCGGMLHSNLIGFHTSRYVENFRRTCLDLL